MIIKLKVEKDFDLKYLKVDAGVRYWEDMEVNGEPDNDIDENPELSPRMPFAVKCGEDRWRWRVTIDLEEGKILGWPEGVTTSGQYKVCDDGEYSLVCRDGTEIVHVESYVPDCLGGGDYIEISIDGEGLIEGFSFDQNDADDIIANAF